MKAIIIYHRADYDGVFSMFIAYNYNIQEFDSVDTLGWNYGDDIPDITDLITEYERIIMVDISFPPEIMTELYSQCLKFGVEFVWIDHHITAITDSINHGYNIVPGLRYDGQAAVENTWNYYFPKDECPAIIQLLGTYDVWNKDRFDWEGMVLPLQFALKAKYSLSPDKIYQDLPELLESSFEDLMPLIESGKLILGYLRGVWGSAIKNYSWEVEVAGKYRGIACISTEFSSNLFGLKSKEYDVMIVLNWRPQNGYFGFSMYIDPEREGEFSAGEYIKSNYRGGGHKCAAGGNLTQEEFLRLINEKKI